MYIPAPLTIGKSPDNFLIKDDSLREWIVPLASILIGILAVLFGLLHWYDLSLLLKGQVTTAMGGILLTLFASMASLAISGQAKINKSQLIVAEYNYWLAENHGLVAKEPLDTGRNPETGNAEFTDMNGDTVFYKVHVKFDHILAGKASKLKKVPYFNISLLPAEKE